MNTQYVYKAIAESVHDGDTYHLRIDLGFRVSIVLPVRLHGCDTPEQNTAVGKTVTNYVRGLLIPVEGEPVDLVVKSYKDRQSFARWVCDVWLPNGDNLSDHLIAMGYAVPMER